MSEKHCRVITQSLGGSPLSAAVQTRTLPPSLQPWWPTSLADWRTHADAVRHSGDSAWLEWLRPAFDARGAAAERLERAAGGRGIVITTGQQAALFGGPLYTLSKAITAIALADALEGALEIPVA